MSEQPLRVVRSTEGTVGDDVIVNVPGNHFDKHGSSNPIVRRMMDAFHDGVIELASLIGPRTVLDVGCGEGLTTAVLIERLHLDFVVGAELEHAAVAQGPSNAPASRFVSASVYHLPFPDEAFDLVVATEVLEHLDDPGTALVELVRVARRGVLVTVPNEPWWRLGNMARGKYLSDLGNTPGHVQHWSTGSFRSFLGRHLDDVEVRRTAMWNQALARL